MNQFEKGDIVRGTPAMVHVLGGVYKVIKISKRSLTLQDLGMRPTHRIGVRTDCVIKIQGAKLS